MTEVTFQTADGVTISANLYPGSNGQAVVLAHMLSRDRNAWGDFPQQLNSQGFSVLNIDLRGHGRSTQQNGQPINFQNFSEHDFNQMPSDLAAAKDYLVKQGLDSKNIHLIGASIGANSALIAAEKDPKTRSVVLLSPGENYHGIQTFAAAKDYSDRPALIISSNEDTQSYQSSKQITSFIGPSAQFISLQNAGHGNDLPRLVPTITSQITQFLIRSKL